MDQLASLKMQLAWGADEAIQVVARNRLAEPRHAAALPSPAPAPAPAVAAVPAVRAVGGAEALADAADSLDALFAAMASFSDCSLQRTAINLVFADGAGAGAIMLIGDAPGEEEDRSGRPFSGPAGRLLDRMLASIELDRRMVRLAYAIPWRPPGNRQPSEHERLLCLPFLRRHIALVRPSLLVLLGTQATASLIPASNASLRRMRGQWQTVSIAGLGGIAALPTCNPDHLLAAPAAKKEAWADLLTLRQRLQSDRTSVT